MDGNLLGADELMVGDKGLTRAFMKMKYICMKVKIICNNGFTPRKI